MELLEGVTHPLEIGVLEIFTTPEGSEPMADVTNSPLEEEISVDGSCRDRMEEALSAEEERGCNVDW
jgi:hypothetical protein